MGTLCCWAAIGAVVGPEAGPEPSRGGKESCSAELLDTIKKQVSSKSVC